MHLLIFGLLLILSSCAKISYVTEQAMGQISLEWNGEDNEKVLMNPNVKKEHKEKIRRIAQYKKYFYQYFNKESTGIYDETTFLEEDAVSYLIIASPKDMIKPIKTSFPFVGEFPYLGFFNKSSAEKYKKKMEDLNFVTYMRPVYAYTTLNRLPFYDNILSSFFYYKDQRLAELIFHELIHTIFFVKNEVEFNESFAEYLARHLTYEYFSYSPKEKKSWEDKLNKDVRIMQLIASQTQKLNQYYSARQKDESPQSILDNFMMREFIPEFKILCLELGLKKCWPLEQEWNNAKFAAFMTYSQEQQLVAQIHQKHNLNLKQLVSHIEKNYAEYQKSDSESFVDFLKEKEKL